MSPSGCGGLQRIMLALYMRKKNKKTEQIGIFVQSCPVQTPSPGYLKEHIIL